MEIRPETPADLEGIRTVHRTAFPSAQEARLVDALRGAGRLAVSLVAEEGAEVVAHVAFTPVDIEADSVGAALGPLAVRPRFRRRGIGSRLVEKGLALCAAAGYDFVVVLGEPSFYRRFGFRRASDWELRDDHGGDSAFQALGLPGGSMPSGALVRYAPEFNPGARPSDDTSGRLLESRQPRSLASRGPIGDPDSSPG